MAGWWALLAFAVGWAAAAADVQPLEVRAVLRVDGPDVGQYSNVKLGSDRLPFIAYYDDLNNRLKGAHCTDSQCSSMHVVVAAKECGRFLSLVMGPDGFPLMSSCDPNTGHLFVTHCLDHGCTQAETSRVQNHLMSSAVGYSSIAVHPSSNLPLVAYYDETRGALMLALCDDLACSTSRGRVIDGGDGYVVGGYPSLAVPPSALPIFSYYDETNQNLKYAACRDANCTQRARIAVLEAEGGADIGRYTSLKVGSDGLPAIMYVDETRGHLKLMHCGDEECSSAGGRAAVVVDAAIGVAAYGEFPELDISPVSGAPVLSYFNQSSAQAGALKLAQCADVACNASVVQVLAAGRCGYGRDSSIAIDSSATPPLVYTSFLAYSRFPLKRCKLVISTYAHPHAHADAPPPPYWDVPGALTRDIDDVCKNETIVPAPLHAR